MKPVHLLLLAAPLALVACAGQTTSVHIGPSYARARGDITLADSGGGIPPANSFQGSLGFGERERGAYVRGQWDLDRHRVKMSTLFSNSAGTTVLDRPYGDIAAGTTVSADLDFTAIVANYSYELVREDRYRVAAGGQLGYYSMDLGLRSATGFEQLETGGYMPMPYVEAEAFVGDFTFGAGGGFMIGPFGDSEGRYWDIETYTNWNLDDQWDVRGGYRYIVLDGDGTATGRDFDAIIDVQGWFLTIGAIF